MSEQQKAGSTMMDVVTERLRQANKKTITDRLLYVAKLTDNLTNKKELSAYYQKFFKQFQSKNDADYITGILLIYQKHCVHLIEASTRVIMETLKDLAATSRDPKGFVSSPVVLASISDIPARCYPLWASRVINTTSKNDDYTTNDPIELTVTEFNVKLLKLGLHLSNLQKDQLKGTLDELSERLPELMPRMEMFDYFLQQKELCTVQQYLDIYEAPIDVVLDSELCWPINSRLFPYD
eukprot:Colp12_sorted_trinity150504_noHs@30581